MIFEQSRLHLDAFDAAQLASEGTYLIGGAFENDGNQTVLLARKTLTADDDACVTRQHRVHFGRGFAVFHINKDGAYSPFHLNFLRIR